MQRLRPAAFLPYLVAVMAVTMAVACQIALESWIGERFPFAMLFFAVLVAAWYGGAGPAVAGALLGAAGAGLLLLPPHGSLAIADGHDRTGLLLYVLVSAGIAVLGGSMRRARDRAERLSALATEQREQLRITFESMGDAIVVTDRQGRITALNRAAEAVTGWSTAAAMGERLETVFAIVNEYTRAPVESPVARALREGVVVGLANHTVLIRRDGTEVPIADSAAPIRDTAGGVTGAVLIFRDVRVERERQKEMERLNRDLEERVVGVSQAERTIRESEERLRLALEAGRMGTWEWNIPGGTVRWSTTLEAIHGLEPGTFPGTFEAYQSDMHPEDRERVLRSISNAIEKGTEHRIQYRIVWKDGSVHWIDAWGRLLRDEQGRPLRMMGVCMDADERKHAEHTMRFLADASAALSVIGEHERTLERVARMAVPFFADWCAVDMLDDREGLRRVAVAHVDPAKVALGHELFRRMPPDPAAAHGPWHIIRTARSEMVAEITDETLVARVPDPACLAIVRELGLKSYIAVPLVARGAVFGVLTFVTAESRRSFDARDLTIAEDLAHRAGIAVENARLYQALREADRRKDEFLALLGHELRNPLAPMSNALRVLTRPGADAPTVAHAKAMMERQVEHMVRLVDDLLDVSRIMSGKVALRRESVDIATVIARAVETVQPAIDAEGHTLTVQMPAQQIWVDGDIVRLAQVVSNLLHNAAKYTDPGGRITVRALREDGQAVIRVRDSGIGLEPQVVPRIFDMFFQAERRTSDGEGGLGIGLSLVRGLVELHGGSVEAHSAGKGEGSEFVVRLPLVAQAPVRAEPARSAPDQRLPMHSQRVLVVDDNADAADSLAMLLRLDGQEVSVAYDGASALALAEKGRPALAFIDLGMPGMNGYELAAAFRSRERLKDVVLVALTGWGQPEDRERSRQAGFDHHLVKPVELEALRRLLAAPPTVNVVPLDGAPARAD